MSLQAFCEVSSLLDKIEIPYISSDTGFWMIRSKAGYFYKEYLDEKFIALGWNYIDQNTSFNSSNVTILKDEIKDRYGNKQPMTAINKCIRFISELKEGDYVIIPNDRSSEIAVCIIGEYYEVDELDYRKELLAIQKIDNKECEINTIACPYKKRRKITPLLRISSRRIGYKLLRAISSYHGLSNMGEYAEDILNCVYNCYEYKEDLIYSINIAKKDRIKARELSILLYGTTELFCNIIDENKLSMTLNVNSPGKLSIRLEEGYKKLKKGAKPLVVLFLLVFGGSGLGFEFPGVARGIIDIFREVRLMDIEVEKAEAELAGMEINNYNKALEFIEKAKNSDINYDEVKEKMEIVLDLNKSLQFESNEEFAIIKDDEKVSTDIEEERLEGEEE